MNITFRLVLVLIICASGCSCASALQGNTCSREDAINAEKEAAYLQDWKALHTSYKLFQHCDDGSIAEGYSVSVVRLLKDQWNKLDELYFLTKSDTEFRQFIMRHINETMSREDQRIISTNTREKCPLELKDLCQMIYRAAN